MENRKLYDDRIEAVNFALANDDGITTREYDEADIILIGVSRCGKTPTSLYLALQFGIRAANYPLSSRTWDRWSCPPPSRPIATNCSASPSCRSGCEIRNQRRANSRYSSLDQCKQELASVERLFRQGGDPLPRYQLPLGRGDQRQDPGSDRPSPPALLTCKAVTAQHTI
jgi:regulator of PEP synthase PpsR (kinase-PPPase family)